MVIIRKFKISETKKVANLIRVVFLKYNKNGSSKNAVEKYLNFYKTDKNNISKTQETFLKSPIFFVAIIDKKNIGVIRGRKDRIVNLFVDGSYHKQGIGRKLVKKFENEAKKDSSKEIKIRASLFSAPFYERIGYKKTTGIRNFMGLKIQPMKKVLE